MHTSTTEKRIPGIACGRRSIPRSKTFQLALTLLAPLAAATLPAQVQPVVASSPLTLASGSNAGIAVVDACGDVYINPNGGLIEIQAGTGTVTTLYPNTNGYGGGPGLAIDNKKANLYFPESGDWYSSKFAQLPIVNCVPGTPNDTFASNTSSLEGYYFGTGGLITTDAAGDVFFATTASGQKDILEETVAGTAASVLMNWPNGITGLVSDAAGNIYFADSTPTGSATTSNIYIIAASASGYGTPAVFATGFSKNVVGLSLDPQGNLYVADNGNTAIYEIPLVTAAGKTALAPADVYEVVSAPTVGSVAVDASHNIYISNYNGYIEEKIGAGIAPQTALGKNATLPVNFVFNSPEAPTAIKLYGGTSTSTVFTQGTGGCATGAFAAGSTCSVNVTFTPTAVGLQTGELVLATATATLSSTAISGVGLGAAATIDPGGVTPATGVLHAPAGVTVDSLGNIFVTDSTANTLTEIPAGTHGTGTTVSTGTITLKAPNGVAVDGQGDIFIADTGNNRVVEIPVVNGVLANAAAFALSPTLKGPEGVAVDGEGDLYIADTGDNNLLFVPNVSGSLDFAAAQNYGTTLNGPSAVTVDANGNVFVAEAGNKDVLEFAAPLGSAAQVLVASGFSNPTGLATDASGSLFVADTGAGSVLRFPNVGGNLGASTFAGSSVLDPFGVAADPSGNLYVTDTTHSEVAFIARVQAATNFGTWGVGSTSDPLTGTIQSSGNVALVFSSPSSVASGNTTAGFAIATDGCAGQTLLPGGSCGITAIFKPTSAESNATESLTLASNAANGTPALELVGTGGTINATTLAVSLASPSGTVTLMAGESVTFKAAINTGPAAAAAGGSVEFFVNGDEAGTSQVSGDAASITLPNGLAGGTDTILAVYSGDGTNYSGSEGTLTETVVALPDTLTLAAITPYTSPQSANDNGANAKGPVIPLIATLTPSAAILPGGSVTFYAGNTVLGVASVLPSSVGFTAELKTSALRAGTSVVVENSSFITNYNLTAVYSGDKTYGGSTSNAVAVAIVGPPSTQPACATATPATCAKNTTGATFTITPANPSLTAATTPAGGPASGSTTLTINSYGGWDGILNFTCSGLPAYATCAPYPGYPNGLPSMPGAPVTPTTVDFIINTNVAPTPPTGTGSMVWWVSGIAGMMLLILRRRVKQMGYLREGQLLTLLGAVLLLGGSAIGISGCSTSSYSSITPAGTSTVTVKVSAAQLIPNSNPAGSTYLPDSNTPTFQITLVVK